MSAFRFIRQMKQEGFLDDDDEMRALCGARS